MSIKEIADSQFASEVLESSTPVVVDFWAPWCGPCKAIGPMLAQLASDYPQVAFAKMNVDDNTETPAKYGIKAIPTLLVFQNGQLVDQITGMVARSRVVQPLEKLAKGESLQAAFPMS
jgi:thioredoxin 1